MVIGLYERVAVIGVVCYGRTVPEPVTEVAMAEETEAVTEAEVTGVGLALLLCCDEGNQQEGELERRPVGHLGTRESVDMCYVDMVYVDMGCVDMRNTECSIVSYGNYHV